MRGSLVDAERLVNDVQKVGGRIPVQLTNILTTVDMLNAQSATVDPAIAIVKAGVAGNLSEKKLQAMLGEAARQQSVADYTGDLRLARLEPLLTHEFSAALKAGAADELIDGLRPAWDAAAAFIGRAQAVISAESSVEHFLASADAGSDAIELWQGLDKHLATIRQISMIVAQFGPRTGAWSLFKEYVGADNHLIEDVAVMATAGWLTSDSAELRKPDPHGHKSSPYYRLQLHLHSIGSAATRYQAWCASEWDRVNGDRPMASQIDEHGVAHELPRPKNPYREQEVA